MVSSFGRGFDSLQVHKTKDQTVFKITVWSFAFLSEYLATNNSTGFYSGINDNPNKIHMHILKVIHRFFTEYHSFTFE